MTVTILAGSLLPTAVFSLQPSLCSPRLALEGLNVWKMLVRGVIWSALAAVAVTAQCAGKRPTSACYSHEARRLNAKFEKHLFETGMWNGGELEMQQQHRCVIEIFDLNFCKFLAPSSAPDMCRSIAISVLLVHADSFVTLYCALVMSLPAVSVWQRKPLCTSGAKVCLLQKTSSLAQHPLSQQHVGSCHCLS